MTTKVPLISNAQVPSKRLYKKTKAKALNKTISQAKMRDDMSPSPTKKFKETFKHRRVSSKVSDHDSLLKPLSRSKKRGI